MKAFEGNTIEFDDINDIRTSQDYDLVIRYEPILPEDWEDVNVTFIRKQSPDPRGPCAEVNKEQDVRSVRLPADSRAAAVYPPICLDAGHSYKVILTFRRYKYNRDTPTASVLIDAVSYL